jgi:hypothetical protein
VLQDRDLVDGQLRDAGLVLLHHLLQLLLALFQLGSIL